MLTSERAARQVAPLSAIAEPTRLRLVQQLIDGPQTVTTLATSLRIEVVNISHHLSILRQAGIVTFIKDGRLKIYNLKPGLYVPSENGEYKGTLKVGIFVMQFLR